MKPNSTANSSEGGAPARSATPSLRPFAPPPLRLSRMITHTLLFAGSLVMLFPLWWMLVISLSRPGDASAAAAAEGLKLAPTCFAWENYPAALRRIGAGEPWEGFLDALANTVVVTALSVAGQILSCSLVGYAFARMRFRGRGPLFILMLSTMMLPAQATMIPTFILFRWFGWIDTFLPLIAPMFAGSAFYIFMFRQFFAQIPEALVEAARIDGCSQFTIWRRIMLPLCRPVIAITGVFTFIFAWNDFMGPLIYLQSEEQLTLAVALNSFKNQYGDFRDLHLLMAASIVTMLPCVVMFFVAQKQLVGGLQLGAVKG